MQRQVDMFFGPEQMEKRKKAEWKAALHKWTDSEGRPMFEAAFVGVKMGFAYVARKDDWKTEKIGLKKLSEEDKKWVEEEMDRRKEADKKRRTADAKRRR